MQEKVLLYLSLGIVGSVVPIFLALLLYFTFGNISQNDTGIKMEVIPDLLLVTFAIATNTISILFDSSDENFFLNLKGFITAFSALVGFALYYSVFSYITAINNIMFEIGNIDLASETEMHETLLKIDKSKDIVLNKLNWKAFFG